MQKYFTPDDLLARMCDSDTIAELPSTITEGLSPDDKDVFYFTDSYILRFVRDDRKLLEMVEAVGIDRICERVENLRTQITLALQDQGYVVHQAALRPHHLFARPPHSMIQHISTRGDLDKIFREYLLPAEKRTSNMLDEKLDINLFTPSGPHFERSHLYLYSYDSALIHDSRLMRLFSERADKFETLQDFADWLEEIRRGVQKRLQADGFRVLRLPQRAYAHDNIFAQTLVYPTGQRIVGSDLVYKFNRHGGQDAQDLILPSDAPYVVYEKNASFPKKRHRIAEYITFAADHKNIPTLTEAMSQLTTLEKMKVVIDSMLGCSLAHDCDFAHRDIKPQNIFVSCTAGELRGKVFDWECACNASEKKRGGEIHGHFGRMTWEEDSSIDKDYRRDDLRNFLLVLVECLIPEDNSKEFLFQIAGANSLVELTMQVMSYLEGKGLSPSILSSINSALNGKYPAGLREFTYELAAEFNIVIGKRGEYEVTRMPENYTPSEYVSDRSSRRV